jgi:hypothetical protein
MSIDRDPRTSAYNQKGDVWRHSYAYHPESLRTVERSSEHYTISDELWWAAKVNEAGDRKLADLLRRAQARIAALETLFIALRDGKLSEIPLDGQPE